MGRRFFISATSVMDDTSKEFADMYPNYLGYYRMYCNYGYGWGGRWFNECKDTTEFGGVTSMNEKELSELNTTISAVVKEWPDGFSMFSNPSLERYDAAVTEDGKRHLLYREGKLLHMLILVDTTYGNGDYPIRIYCYKK